MTWVQQQQQTKYSNAFCRCFIKKNPLSIQVSDSAESSLGHQDGMITVLLHSLGSFIHFELICKLQTTLHTSFALFTYGVQHIINNETITCRMNQSLPYYIYLGQSESNHSLVNLNWTILLQIWPGYSFIVTSDVPPCWHTWLCGVAVIPESDQTATS